MGRWKRTVASVEFTAQGGCSECDARPTDSADDQEYIVRRLTPTECARLQGFPDDWVSDVQSSDSAEYKMWGNGIALPCILPMMNAMKKIIKESYACG